MVDEPHQQFARIARRIAERRPARSTRRRASVPGAAQESRSRARPRRKARCRRRSARRCSANRRVARAARDSATARNGCRRLRARPPRRRAHRALPRACKARRARAAHSAKRNAISSSTSTRKNDANAQPRRRRMDERRVDRARPRAAPTALARRSSTRRCAHSTQPQDLVLDRVGGGARRRECRRARRVLDQRDAARRASDELRGECRFGHVGCPRVSGDADCHQCTSYRHACDVNRTDRSPGACYKRKRAPHEDSRRARVRCRLVTAGRLAAADGSERFPVAARSSPRPSPVPPGARCARQPARLAAAATAAAAAARLRAGGRGAATVAGAGAVTGARERRAVRSPGTPPPPAAAAPPDLPATAPPPPLPRRAPRSAA